MTDITNMPPPAPKMHLDAAVLRETAQHGRTQYDVERMANFLTDGTILMVIDADAWDPIDRSRLRPPDLMTDGTYVWHAHMADLVAKHAPRLPDAFVADVVAQGYEQRDVSPERQAEMLAGEHTRGVQVARQLAAQRSAERPPRRRNLGHHR